jgi:hypothetical protein
MSRKMAHLTPKLSIPSIDMIIAILPKCIDHPYAKLQLYDRSHTILALILITNHPKNRIVTLDFIRNYADPNLLVKA